MRVCVTGGTGFIASHVIASLLARGDEVVTTVRDPGRADKIGHLSAMDGAEERLTLVEADLLDEGAFDSVVSGCDAVLHMASPYVVSVEDPQRDLVDPAELGTRNVLSACAKAESVRRVIVTSSMAAVTDQPGRRTLSEADWNEKSSLTRNPYYYSKVRGERAAWAFVDEQRPRFDLVVINPVLVIGPSLTRALNTSNQIFRDLLTRTFPAIMGLSWGVVDVRDTAAAHLAAIDHPHASGRYLCSSETVSMRQAVEWLREAGFEGRLPTRRMDNPLGNLAAIGMSYFQPSAVGSYLRTNIGRPPRLDTTKIRTELGLAFRHPRTTLIDTVEDLIRWGHVPDSVRAAA